MSGIPAGAGSLLGKRLGKYEILALLALGGTAEIYLARIGGAAGFEKYVVVKCLHDHLADDAEFVKMFLDEARLSAVLDHSNIVQTMELGEHEDRYYMVMEFLAGLSLAMVVRRGSDRLQSGKIPVPLVLNIAAQACAGLHYAHERTSNGKPLNMVHRDISPQNLVISFEGVVKVVDFGIARAELRETKTKAGTIKGKFAYMSPEQCVANNVDRRTDVFALGVIVHELLTGRRLFKRNSPYETYQAVLECAVEPPSKHNHELDPALDAVVMKALAKDKDDRYATAEAFGDAMLGYLHHRGKPSGPAEISRWFDQFFAQEIEEHGERMRELISGREFAGETGAGWDEDEEESKKSGATLDISRGKADTRGADGKSIDLDSQDLEEVRPSNASLDEMVAELDDEGGSDDDEMPAEKTRIELNPLEKLGELDKVARTPPPTKVPTGSVPGPAPLPAPPTVALGAPRQAVGPKASGKFPDLANLPTMIAEEDRAPELAQTSLGAGAAQPASAMTQTMADLPPSAPPGAYSATHGAVRPSGLQAAMAGAPPAPVPVTPPGGSLYPVVQGRPMSTDLAPSNAPIPQRSPVQAPASHFDPQHGPAHATPQHGNAQPHGNPQHAASMVSPVGDQYPSAVDWAQAAAQPARAIPPWMLAILFTGAVGVALLLTLLIAKLFG